MREILFRGRRTDNHQWVYGYLVIDACENPNPYIIADRKIRVEHKSIGQFTGLVDKTGKRIFEGDIVLKRTYHGKKAFPVEFGGGMFYCGFGGGSSTATHRYTLEDKQIKVIGNIRDNPELLEVTPDE